MPSRLIRALPFLEWAREYRRDTLVSDLVAAVVVTIMLVPQSLAYAMLAGLPPHIGLYASILPLVAYALFGTSRALAVGPVAVVSLMTATAVGGIAATGTEDYLAAAIVLAMESGVILIALGVLRLGFLANFLSHSVISGFITASGILIATSQLKHLFGVRTKGDTMPDLVGQLVSSIPDINWITLVIGVLATGFLFWVRKQLKPLLRRIGLGPLAADIVAKTGPVVAVIVSIVAVAGLSLDAEGVKVVGAIPGGLPPMGLPLLNPDLWIDLFVPALLISIIGFVESISVAQTFAAKRRQRVDANSELVGLGAANVASSLTGGFPVTGGFSRSVVNFDAGAQTPMAGVFTAVGILVTTLFLSHLFAKLPQAVLAATIIVAVLSLVDLGAVKRTWDYSKADAVAMAVTIVVVLFVGVEIGVVAGVAVSLALFLFRTSRPHMAIVGRVPGTEHFRNVERHKVVESEAVLTVRVDESLYFANARFLEDRIYDLVASRAEVKHVVLMCSAVNMIDASALESLEAIAERLKAAGVKFHLSEVKGPVMDRLKRTHFLDHLTGEVFLSQQAAMRALDPGTCGPGPAAEARLVS
ncbi:sulfate permease [Zavarzinia compransoris]|uniref:SulP family inorganic anion transporter n=1 Tax=Zavarzinia marina TaxID=2911065 RepID=UPI001F17D953|nr:sulfate permease [Zavarzinia marina]MCF4165887.1 sulfate permease [Zavarzinia marina]